MVMFQAQDNFAAEIDGVPVTVAKGDVFASGHPVVKLDAGRGLLFKPLTDDADDKPKTPRKAAAKAGSDG